MLVDLSASKAFLVFLTCRCHKESIASITPRVVTQISPCRQRLFLHAEIANGSSSDEEDLEDDGDESEDDDDDDDDGDDEDDEDGSDESGEESEEFEDQGSDSDASEEMERQQAEAEVMRAVPKGHVVFEG